MADDGPARLQQALADHQAGRLHAAEAGYQTILADQPSQPDALHLLGVLRAQSGDRETALDLIAKAVNLAPGRADIRANLGKVLLDLDRVAAALECYQSALSVAPGDLQCLNGLGQALRRSGRCDEAIAVYREALARDPENGGIHHNLGNALRALGRLEEAVSAYRRASVLAPNSVASFICLGQTLADREQPEEAIEAFQAALAIQPGDSHALNQLGVVLQRHRGLEEAIDCYQAAVQNDAMNADAHNNLGNGLKTQGSIEEAIAAYRRALAVNPNHAQAHYNLGTALFDECDPREAIEALEKAIVADPNHGRARFFLGVFYEVMGDLAAAEGHLQALREGDQDWDYLLRSWDFVKAVRGPNTLLFAHGFDTLAHAINRARPDGLVLEFGVRGGTSIREIARHVDGPVHGFDSFEGLPESWDNRPAGLYSCQGNLPEVPEQVALHVGWFADTLPTFVAAQAGPIRFMNVDCDIYSSTKTVFDLLGKRITSGSVVLFDEYLCNPNWEQDEHRAFQEAAARFQWPYEFIAFNLHSRQAAILIH